MNNEPAFPRPAVFTEVHGLTSVEQDGMMLRDYFAARMMVFNLSKALMPNKDYDYSNAAIASYRMADAMLEARKVNSYD